MTRPADAALSAEAVVFDFDGVIVETEEPQFLAWRSVWVGYGLELRFEEWSACIGTTSRTTFDPFLELVARTGVDLVEDEVRATKRRLAADLMRDAPAQPGLVAWLEEARGLGLRVGIASSSTRDWIDEHLERLGLSGRFDAVASLDETVVPKPDPAAYLLASRKLGVPPDRVLAVEDSANGLASAKAAGCACVVVQTRMTAHMEFGAADAILESMSVTTLAGLLRRVVPETQTAFGRNGTATRAGPS